MCARFAQTSHQTNIRNLHFDFYIYEKHIQVYFYSTRKQRT